MDYMVRRTIGEDPLGEFVTDAAVAMRRRLEDGVRRGWGLSWRDGDYTDAQVMTRLSLACSHLFAALETTDDPDEWRKRAADVANQAFMAADPARRGPR